MRERVCVCVCVCERERERECVCEREMGWGGGRLCLMTYLVYVNMVRFDVSCFSLIAKHIRA